MRSITVLLMICYCIFSSAHAQTATAYDSVLAKKLNADDYGMKRYIMVILKTGSATETDSLKVSNIFKGHMKNIQSLAAQNKLVVAGPLGDNDKKYEGIFVLNTENIEDAKKMLATDPAVQEKFLEPELYLWYCTAALQQITELHNRIQKKHF